MARTSFRTASIPCSICFDMIATFGGNVQMDVAIPRMAERIDLHAERTGQVGQLVDKLGNPSEGNHHIFRDIHGGVFLDAKRDLAADLPHLGPLVGIGGQEDIDRFVFQANLTHLLDFSIDHARSTVGFDEQERFAVFDSRETAAGRQPVPGTGGP